MKKINPQALLIAKYLNEWLEYHVPSIKACSPYTKRNYETSVALYVMFLRSVKQISPKTLSAQCFSLENMNEWILWLKEHRSCSPAKTPNTTARTFCSATKGKTRLRGQFVVLQKPQTGLYGRCAALQDQ